MTTRNSPRRRPLAPLTSYEETVVAALIAVDLTVHAESQDLPSVDEHEWDEVHDAALDSFPASDAPSWGALRVGPPRSYRYAPAAG